MALNALVLLASAKILPLNGYMWPQHRISGPSEAHLSDQALVGAGLEPLRCPTAIFDACNRFYGSTLPYAELERGSPVPKGARLLAPPFWAAQAGTAFGADLRATPRRPYRAHAPHRARHTTPKTAIRNPIRRCCCCTPFPPPVCRYRCRYCRARHTNDQRHFDGVKQAEGRPPVASDGLGVATRSLGVHTAAGVFPITFCVSSARLPRPLCFVINLITACLPNYDPRASG